MNKNLTSTLAYTQLLKKLQKVIDQGVTNARRAVERQLVETYWNIGKELDASLMQGKGSRLQNANLIGRLSKDLNYSESRLYGIVNFYRKFPKLPQEILLTWTQYNVLVKVDDPRKRDYYTKLAIKKDIGARKLQILILNDKQKKMDADYDKKIKQIKGKRGSLYHYKIITDKSIKLKPKRVLIDVGFNITQEVSVKREGQLIGGTYVRSIKNENDYDIIIAYPIAESLYTYRAFVQRVVDGDTLIINIDCGFYTWMNHRVRLRGIDTPELSQYVGQQAKAFVKDELSQCECIVIKSYKMEKYGRYLVDVYYLPKEKDPVVIAAEGKFLNQELLDRGWAVEMR